MTQFQLDYGDKDGRDWFNTLDDFTQGYVEAMFFTEANPDNEELADKAVMDLSEEARKLIVEDCERFQEANAETLDEAYDQLKNDYDATKAGRDLWFNRNRHGVGYWDRDLGDTGDALASAAKAYKEISLYLSDEGKLYLG